MGKAFSLYSQVEKFNKEHLARKVYLELTTKDMFDRQLETLKSARLTDR